MGEGMIAGTVCRVRQKRGRAPGGFLKRGSIVALAPIDRPATFPLRLHLPGRRTSGCCSATCAAVPACPSRIAMSPAGTSGTPATLAELGKRGRSCNGAGD